MSGNVLCIAAVLLGIDATWKPLPEGDGTQYWIQIEPHLVDTLLSGEPIQSHVPPGAGEVRDFLITVGTQELPQAISPPAKAELPAAPNRVDPDPGARPIGAEQAAHSEPVEVTREGKSRSPSDQEPPQEASLEESRQPGPAKPGAPLTIALFTLFGSLGANLYLGWITWNTRSRYRALVRGAADVPAE